MTDTQINLWFDIFKVIMFSLLGTGIVTLFMAVGYIVFTLNKNDTPKIGKGMGL